MKTVDVIIPVYKPDKKLLLLLDRLEHQSVPVNKIILINTEQKYFDRLVYGTSFYDTYRNISVIHISKKEFDHGNTRNKAVKASAADIFVMMTQDAIPADEYLIEKLTKPLEEEQTAVSYARQLPAEDCGEAERYTRQFNYPEQSRLKTKEDLGELGIKTYFCSNVCAAYNREIFKDLGGFVKRTIFNEDMIFAAKAVDMGYHISYMAEAQVIHSHNYTCTQQFHRNFDLGVSQAEHPEVFAGLRSEGEGISLIKKTTAYLWKTKNRKKIPILYINSFCKYAGFFLGKHFRVLPRFMILKCSMSKAYWK